MTTLETNTAPLEAGGEGVHTPEKAVRWAIPLSLLACVLLAFFDKISIAALFSDSHFQQAMGMDFDTTRLGILMSAFLLSYGFSSVLLSGLGDRIAPLRLLTGMMVVWCILMVMMGFTHNYTVMVTLRILLGIAEGPLFPLAFAIVRQQRHRAVVHVDDVFAGDVLRGGEDDAGLRERRIGHDGLQDAAGNGGPHDDAMQDALIVDVAQVAGRAADLAVGIHAGHAFADQPTGLGCSFRHRALLQNIPGNPKSN